MLPTLRPLEPALADVRGRGRRCPQILRVFFCSLLFTGLLSPSAARADDPPPAAPAPFSEDYTWMNGQSRQKDFPLQIVKALTMSVYFDTYYAYSLNNPIDNTLTGNATVGRHNEFQINLASVGFEWNYRSVIGRFSLQYGNMINIAQDLDGSAARGRNNAIANMRYLREATLGYHFDVLSGINVEAGIFMSFMGLESYLLAENWNYARSLACEHTPFYFQGFRVQIYATPKVKIEPWLMNGWQTYGRWTFAPAGGLQLRLSPREAFTFFANFYVGADTRGVQGRVRFHHDNSFVVRYFNRPGSRGFSKLAFSLNTHFGFEQGGDGLPGIADAYVFAVTLAQRVWLFRDYLALTVRGEYFHNPSRYLAQYPPPDFFTTPGTDFQAWGFTGTIEAMPRDFLSLRAEVVWRQSTVPYFSGPGGTTSSDGFQNPLETGFMAHSATEQTLFIVSANFRL